MWMKLLLASCHLHHVLPAGAAFMNLKGFFWCAVSRMWPKNSVQHATKLLPNDLQTRILPKWASQQHWMRLRWMNWELSKSAWGSTCSPPSMLCAMLPFGFSCMYPLSQKSLWWLASRGSRNIETWPLLPLSPRSVITLPHSLEGLSQKGVGLIGAWISQVHGKRSREKLFGTWSALLLIWQFTIARLLSEGLWNTSPSALAEWLNDINCQFVLLVLLQGKQWVPTYPKKECVNGIYIHG